MAKQIVFVIDKSGSMQGSETMVVTGYNELLQEQKAESGTMLLTTILFNTSAVTIHNCIEITDTANLNRSDYVPSGSTALFDAIGDTVTEIRESNTSEGGLLVIMTDGMENASMRYTYESVKQLLNRLKEYGWEVLYLGADLKDFTDAERMGIHREQHMSVAKENLYPAMKDISNGIKEFRKGNPMRFSRTSNDKLFDKTLPCKTTAQGWALIDTGSPISFGDLDVFEMDRDRYTVDRNSLTEEVRHHLGIDIAAVIGMNILRHYDLRIDYMSKISEYHIHHAHTPQLRMEQGTSLHYVMGIPVVNASVNGKVVPVYVDTCSHHTFIDKALIKGPQVGIVYDFYPGIGMFESLTYQTKLSLCNCDFIINAAVLPRSLQYLMHYSGVKGIIGLDVLKQQRTWLGFLSGVLAFDAAQTSYN